MKFSIPKKIAVLMGGPGSERDVSLATGRGVVKALQSLGSDVTEVDVKSADFELPRGTELAFLTIHGTFGEDGQLQQILEDRGVPYTGEGIAGSELAFDGGDGLQAAARKGQLRRAHSASQLRVQPNRELPGGQQDSLTMTVVGLIVAGVKDFH